MKKTKLDTIKDDIKRYFGFLFDKEYKFRDDHHFLEAPGYWSLELESPDCLIRIRSDRDQLLISFASPIDRSYQVGLEPMIYFLSGGQNFVGPFERNLAWGKKKQFERLATLLREYIDQITPYLGVNFYKYKSEIINAGNKYMGESLQKYTQKMRSQK